MNFPEGNWKLYLVSKNKYDVFYQVLYPMILGFILAIFCSFLITELLKKPAQLQVMVNEAKKELIQSFEMVNEQNKRLLNFSYIVSHNLRSHTSNIQAIGALIEHAETDDERKELLQLLMNVSGLLNDTLLNLNNVVNIQTSIDVIREPLLLKTYIDKTVEVLSDQVSSTGARIINLVPNSIVVDFNPAYLESILLNFIFNAIRYRSIERNPIIELSVLSESEKIILKIKDNGIGIDLSKNGDQLFGMYKTFTENPDSKGIGLFISKNQIDAMGGSVTVESVVDEGTTFTIYFKQQPRVF
ncbi:MAG: HAMP domain-containing histidine kinase [Pedobacter sp.]|nr:MAG: HAMP domain-containing histidine kinase [Pedobacter sp.]